MNKNWRDNRRRSTVSRMRTLTDHRPIVSFCTVFLNFKVKIECLPVFVNYQSNYCAIRYVKIERRIDFKDGLAYTSEEFIDRYGVADGMQQWEMAEPGEKI